MTPTRTLLLVLALLACLAGAAWADEPAAESAAAPAAEAAAAKGLTPADLAEWIKAEPVALWAMLILKFGPAALGFLFLVLWWVRRDRVRGGILPAAPRVEPTTPFELPAALMLIGAGILLIFVLYASLAGRELTGWVGTAVSMGSLQFGLLCIALAILLRRRQLQAGSPEGALSWVGRAFQTFCIALLFVLPVNALYVQLLDALDVPITLYGPIEEVVKGEDPALPWVLAFLAVVLAPIAEESIFRGMLYPAIRKALGARAGVWGAAVITSFLFALMHGHVVSFIPLFTLAMVLAAVFERTDSLATVIGAHALWNASTMAPLLIRSMS